MHDNRSFLFFLLFLFLIEANLIIFVAEYTNWEDRLLTLSNVLQLATISNPNADSCARHAVIVIYLFSFLIHPNFCLFYTSFSEYNSFNCHSILFLTLQVPLQNIFL